MFLIPLIAAIALVVGYVFVTDASAPSKALLAALLVVSLACTFSFPRLRLAGLLIQVGLSVFVLRSGRPDLRCAGRSLRHWIAAAAARRA